MPLKIVCILVLFNSCLIAKGQLCPGGGTAFSNAVTFDPAWIYGCNTGTSCNGGVHFDNRISCEPTTSLDACAPSPSCVTLSNSASDIWFKFYASAEAVVIKGFQNTSLVIGLQAFSGGPTCGSLTDIGCAVSAGPSSGVTLTLTGLTAGQLYYYRMFGSAGPVSQRSGLYCFCGTIGLQNYILPSVLKSFTAKNTNESNQLRWEFNPESSVSYAEVQKSLNGINFFKLKNIDADNIQREYSYSEKISSGNNITYYRLKLVEVNGKTTYSPTLLLKGKTGSGITMLSNSPGKPVEVQANEAVTLKMFNTNGTFVRSYSLKPGRNTIETKSLSNGIYLMQNAGNNSGIKMIVLNN